MEHIINEIMEWCQNDTKYLQELIDELQNIVDNNTPIEDEILDSCRTFMTKNKCFISIQDIDGGYDFSYYGQDKKLIDGGMLESEGYMTIGDILKDASSLLNDGVCKHLEDILDFDTLFEIYDFEDEI